MRKRLASTGRELTDEYLASLRTPVERFDPDLAIQIIWRKASEALEQGDQRYNAEQ